MDEFTTAYCVCALWSSTGDDDVPLDQDYSIDDFALDTLVGIIDDCNQFQKMQAQRLEEAYKFPDYTPARAGHDFWLTRNGHGAGFWDRGLGRLGDMLTEAAKMEGSVDLYVDDKGYVHAA